MFGGLAFILKIAEDVPNWGRVTVGWTLALMFFAPTIDTIILANSYALLKFKIEANFNIKLQYNKKEYINVA